MLIVDLLAFDGLDDTRLVVETVELGGVSLQHFRAFTLGSTIKPDEILRRVTLPRAASRRRSTSRVRLGPGSSAKHE